MAILSLFLELLLLAIIKSGGTMEISDLSATLLIMLFSLCFLIDTGRNKRLRKIYNSSLRAGYFLRLAILYFDIYGHKIYVLPNTVGDATVFYREARARALAITEGLSVLPSVRGEFPAMMAKFFSIIGSNRLYGQFLNMLCSIVALLFCAYALSELDIKDKTKKRVFFILCMLPNYAILSTAFLREGIIYMFLSMSMYFFILWTRKKRNIYFIEAALLTFPAAYFHSGSIAILVGYIALLVLYDNMTQEIHVKFNNIFLAIILFLATAFFLSRNAGSFLGKFSNTDSLSDIANTYDSGRTSYAKYVGNSNNPVNFIIFTIPRLFFFLFSPLPWMWSSPGDLIAFLFSSLFYLIVIIKAFQYLRTKNPKNRSLLIILLMIAFGATFVFAWGTSNGGTAARHRDKLALLYGLILALSMEEKRKKRRIQHNYPLEEVLNKEAVGI